MAAILKETYEDLLTGKDGNNHVSVNKLRPLGERVEVFRDRLKIVKKWNRNHRLLPQMNLDLGYLVMILSFSNST